MQKRYYARGPYDRRWSRLHGRSNPLRDARLLRKLTQEQAAAEIGINRSQLARYESGLAYPSLNHVKRKIERFIAAATAEPALSQIE